MDALSQAIEVVRQAEGELRQWLLRAAEQGDYETTRKLAEWANHLKQIVKQNGSLEREPRSVEPANGQPQPHTEPEAVRPAVYKNNNTGKGKAKARRPAKSKKSKVAGGEYPRFLRDGEELLKLGWSKREKKVYRHKAPKRVVFLVSEAIQRVGQQGERFAMDQVLPIHDPESDSEVPSYQAYLSLAWLRKENLIVQHGRQGYSLLPGTNLTDAVQERWELLLRS